MIDAWRSSGVFESDRAEEHLRGLSEEVGRRLGPGMALELHLRRSFEGRLGGDLSRTMVHRSPLAGYVARALGAQALTTGEHIVGGVADLDPRSASGVALLAHEAAHVIQRATHGDGEGAAQHFERAVMAEPEPGTATPAPGINIDGLSERVYQRLVDELLRERDRAAWVG
jgi:hypothetical protein